MIFNLNEFLTSVSFALDFMEMDVLGAPSNHGRRIAYISLKIGQELGMSLEELHDIVALAILHDNGVGEKSLYEKLRVNGEVSLTNLEKSRVHCSIGEENIANYPFLTDVKNVIKYHHEKYDGTGFFKLKKDEIPIMSQIIQFANVVEMNCNLIQCDRNKIYKFVDENDGVAFSSKIVMAFKNVSNCDEFWSEIASNDIGEILKRDMPKYSFDISFEKIHEITSVLSKIIDSKSEYTQRHSTGLSKKVEVMCDFYKVTGDEKMKLIIAADLHDIGKLAVPNEILDSPKKLTKEEFEIIKKHPYYTRTTLESISGFEEITEWASNHHEKLNGKGYPLGLYADELDFNSRLMACLDIYQAITEDRPYRKALSHSEAMEILNTMKHNGYIDGKIVSDIDYVFKD